MKSPGTPEANLKTVWGFIEDYWKDNPVQDHYSTMKLSMFLNLEAPHERMPKLKGRAIEVRNLMPALMHAWKHFMHPSQKPFELIVLTGLQASCKLDEILAQYPEVDKLPRQEAAEFQSSAWLYAKCQNAAARHYGSLAGGSLMIFDVTIKTHQMLHGALRAGHLNPRHGWNFAGEDFMGKMKELMQSCVRGNNPGASVIKLMDKYSYALHYQLLQLDISLHLESA